MADGEEQIKAQEQHEDQEEPELASPSAAASKDKEGGLVLPLTRVKKLIKAEIDVKMASSEAIFLIGRATELALEEMLAKAHASMSRDGRKTVLYKDIANAVQSWEALDILADAVPQKVLASTLTQQQDKKPQK